MKIRIKQDYYNYLVYLNDSPKPVLQGSEQSRWFIDTWVLLNNRNELCLKIKSTFRLDFWKVRFHIIVPYLQLNAQLKAQNFFKGHWQLVHNNDTYDYYIHQGHKKSLFKNGKQIASINKPSANFLETDTCIIDCNHNENIELVISFELCFFTGKSNDGSLFKFDFGNLTKSVKDFDEHWKPSSN